MKEEAEIMRQVTQKAALKTYKELAKDISYRWGCRGSTRFKLAGKGARAACTLIPCAGPVRPPQNAPSPAALSPCPLCSAAPSTLAGGHRSSTG